MILVRPSRRLVVHDRGRVLADLACAIASGGGYQRLPGDRRDEGRPFRRRFVTRRHPRRHRGRARGPGRAARWSFVTVIVDASLIIDAVCDSGSRGAAARGALGEQPAAEALIAPGHFAFEIMSGLRVAANRPGHPFQDADISQALRDAESYEIMIEGTPWADVHRAWELAEQSLLYADAVYVAAAERHRTALLTADSRIERSGASMRCRIITVSFTGEGAATGTPTT